MSVDAGVEAAIALPAEQVAAFPGDPGNAPHRARLEALLEGRASGGTS
jgi:hypothetical protein